ncbi:MAG: phage portal protein family protein [Fusobacteriaceae bacterium]
MNKKLVMGSEVMRLFSEMKQEDLEIDLNDIKLVSKDIDVNSALNKIERSVAGREYFIKNIGDSNEELLQKIESIFSGVKFNRAFNHILKARYYGFSCFEIVYSDEYNVESLIPLPHSKIKYDKKDKKWYMEDGDAKIEITYDKFLLPIHNWRPDQVTGHSIFEVCNSSFKDKELFRNQLRGIARKYGETIMITGYDPEEDEKELEKKAEKLKEMEGKTVMMMPVEFLGRSNGATLNDSLHIIKLSDLDPEIYTKLEKTEKLKLIQNILGSTLTMEVGSVGSQALGTIHMEAEEQVVEECCMFISDCLQNLLESVLPLHGYEPKEFYFSLEKKRDVSKELQVEKETEIVTNQKIINVSQLAASGYPLSKEYVAEYLGIDVSQIKDPVLEFASKKKDLDSILHNKRAIKDKILKQSEESFLSSFSSNLKEQLISQLNKTSKSFLNPIEFNFDTFYDHAFIVKLIAYLEEGESIAEFEEELNPFEMKFHEAIAYAVKKNPELIDKIDTMQEEVRAQSFWVKRSTEITSTEKLMKELQKNLDDGGTYKEWLKNISDVVDKVGMGNDGWYSANVYRTNMLSFYNAGVYQQQMDNIDNQPYWMYDGIADDRQSDICRELDGKVYAADDPIWSKIYPSNHYQCRSGVISLSEEEIETMGLKVTKPNKRVKGMDLGSFEGNPANSYWKNLEKNVIKKEKRLSVGG